MEPYADVTVSPTNECLRFSHEDGFYPVSESGHLGQADCKNNLVLLHRNLRQGTTSTSMYEYDVRTDLDSSSLFSLPSALQSGLGTSGRRLGMLANYQIEKAS